MDVDSNSSAIPVAPAMRDAGEARSIQEADDLRGQILERLIDLSEPVAPPARWVRFGSRKSVRFFSRESSELLSELGGQFSHDQLVTASVAVRTSAGDLELSKVLETRQAFLIRGDVTGRRPINLVSQRGTLFSGSCEWHDLAHEATEGASAHDGPSVLCASDAELLIFVNSGISCTPLAGAGGITGAQVSALIEKRLRNAGRRRYHLVLLGWQPDLFQNEPSAKNLAAIRHIAAIQPTYGFDPRVMFSVWLPSGAELTRIRWAHAFVDRNKLTTEFKASLEKSLYSPADALAVLGDRQPTNWAQAHAELASAVEGSRVVPRVSDARVALEKLERVFRDRVLHPLEAGQAKTGVAALVSLLQADLATQWYHDLELVAAARRVIAGQHPRYTTRIDDNALIRKLQIITAILKSVKTKVE